MKIMKINNPDPIWHRNLSFVKSGIRIFAGIVLCNGMLVSAGILLIIAEILGIAEEIV